MRTLWQDLKYGARALRKSPAFTAVAVLAIALGVGANTAIFSVVNTVLLRALPYENSERLVALYTGRGPSAPGGPLSYPDLLDYRSQTRAFEYVAGYQGVGTVMSVGQGDEPERVRGTEVMADLFPALGVRAARGRVFTREEDAEGGPGVIVISDGLWRRRFGADPNVVGREVKMGLSGRAATVIGVMPPGFKFPPDESEALDYYTPFVAQNAKPNADSMKNRGSVFIPTVAKLRDDATVEQAAAEVETIANRLAAEYPATSANRRARVVRLHEDLVGQVRPALLVLLGAVGLVLLIACANVANLLLARAASRGREIAVRTALGATRARVARQLLTESLLLSLTGGAAGLLLSVWGVEAIVKLSPASVPRLAETSIDARVFAFALGVSILTGLVFGLAPALAASKTDLAESLKEGGRGGSAGARRSRLRSALVVSEVALSLVLLVGAGLLIKSFRQLVTTDPGYSPERVLAVTVALNTQKFADEDSRAAYYREAVARIGQLPGVESAGLTRLLPLGPSDIFNSFNIAGRPPFAPGERNSARSYTVSPEYFRALGVPLRRGRAFTEADGKNSNPVIVVNESFVSTYFRGEEPLGQHVVLDGPDDKPLPPREVVGVVGNVRFQKFNDDEQPEYYIPFEQSPSAVTQVVVRARGGDAAALTSSVRSALKGVDPNLLIWRTQTMDELVSQSVAPQRFNVALLGFFAALAMTLAAVGIYGVMSYTVTQRRHEIGIRMALGAQRRDVLRLVVRQGMLLTLAGLGLGLAGALALTRLMSSLLYGVSATDPLVFAAVSLLLAAVALLASYVPARRATKVDPMVALRYE
ncbi:MAG TPA: ABC transporter permease [Pyrinomonadaceae bacterium]|jgi:putative ABC transport system permease protein|nr:ABC transporter permease [Pyrinomonadaceae bacterium]